MDPLQAALAVLSGSVVGFVLGLIGGGGSILATPTLLYVVGLSPHVAIGTGALAVSASAFANLAGHARAGNVRWRAAVPFAAVGVVAAALGSVLGKAFDGQRLLLLFALLMLGIGALMLWRSTRRADPARERPERPGGSVTLVVCATAVGLLAGFFGIGGGFLIVPGLLAATGMPMICAVGSSLLAVGAFGLTAAGSYALSGLVNWPIAVEYICGGVAGGYLGMRIACHMGKQRALLGRIFAGVIFAVAFYMIYRTAAAIRG